MRTFLLVSGLLVLATQAAHADGRSELAKQLVASGTTGVHTDPATGTVFEIVPPMSEVSNDFLVAVRGAGGDYQGHYRISPKGAIAEVGWVARGAGGRFTRHERRLLPGGVVEERHEHGRITRSVGRRVLSELFRQEPGEPRALARAVRLDHVGGRLVQTTVEPGHVERSWISGSSTEGNTTIKKTAARTRFSEKQLLAAMRASSPTARTALVRPRR